MNQLYPHVVAWVVALPVFAWIEWTHPGFVSYVFPFPVLIAIPAGLALLTLFFDKAKE